MENSNEGRRISTVQFGEVTVEKKHVFNFPNGLLGFEDLRDFVLISEEETVPFKWLISIDKPEIGFPCLSPWHIDLTYEPGNDFNMETEVILVVITLEDEKGVMTANMKAPVILDVKQQSGKQLILPSEKYPTNYIIPKQ